MIHHCTIADAPRRVTDRSAPPARLAVARRLTVSAIGMLLLLASMVATLGAQQPATQRPDSAKATAAPRRASWTSDRRTFGVGDILQVQVDEYALAEANKDNTNSASRRRQMGMGIEPPSMPGGGTPAMGNINGSVETSDAGASHQRGNASRDTRYVGDLAVRVVAITPEGLLQIKGTKTIDVDKNKAVLTITGFVRPIDVGTRDIIRSDVIADAQISYSAKGGLGKPKNGIVGKILGLFWP